LSELSANPTGSGGFNPFVDIQVADNLEGGIHYTSRKTNASLVYFSITTRKISIPAVYKDVTKKVLVKKGGMKAWREVPCTIPERGKVLPIHYALGSAALNASAKRIIDRYVLKVLENDLNAIVEIGSHTDAQGSDQFNLTLSENRAKNVVEYLISKGVDSSRLIGVGYGETKLLNSCTNGVSCSDQQHLTNRRTEFKVF